MQKYIRDAHLADSIVSHGTSVDTVEEFISECITRRIGLGNPHSDVVKMIDINWLTTTREITRPIVVNVFHKLSADRPMEEQAMNLDEDENEDEIDEELALLDRYYQGDDIDADVVVVIDNIGEEVPVSVAEVAAQMERPRKRRRGKASTTTA